MASASQSLPGLDIPALKNQLYEACLPVVEERGPDTIFKQREIFELHTIPNDDIRILLVVMQGLVDDKLFKTVNQGSVGWILRDREEARKYVIPSFYFYFYGPRSLKFKNRMLQFLWPNQYLQDIH